MNILAFLSYITIILSIFFFGLVIRYLQNQVLKQREMKNKQLINGYVKKGLCFNCGANKNSSDKYCSSCGENLYYECKSCKENRVVGSNFCQECGEN